MPLIAAAGDKQCEALGAGAVQPEVAALSFGTTATIGTTHRRYLEAIPLVPPYPATIPGAWLVELQVMRGFWVEWFKREFGATEVARAAARDIPPEGLFEELLPWTPSPPWSTSRTGSSPIQRRNAPTRISIGRSTCRCTTG
jgi:sugar (pentulose or hexulose) kinase